MLPLQQAREVSQSIREYIHATFAFSNEAVERAFYDFIEHPDKGMIKGPYIRIRTPFLSADPKEGIPLEIKPGFTPHAHQLKAFKKLSCNDGHEPEPTLLTTGTGSGKTEAFEFPILDYCRKNRHRRGIKVIILYPMNALATDQAKRLAKDIWNDPLLKGEIRAGLFIGQGKGYIRRAETMGEENIIEDRDAIIESAPDILLTNFKMLDIGLMRSEYSRLWQYNTQDPTLLKFIVLDELHTYDGAQGTDVANLLRRLKLRLNIPEKHICPIGTSATLGSGEEARKKLCDYASDIFGEKITEEALIGERRLTAAELFEGEAYDAMPTISAIRKLKIDEHEDYNSYLEKQKKLWRIRANTPTELGERLNEIAFVRLLTDICSQEGAIHVQRLMDRLVKDNADYANLPEKDGEIRPRAIVLESVLALIAEAKRPVGNSVRTMPYLFLQVQLWIRELSGIRRIVGETPEFKWRDEIEKSDEDRRFFPAWFCRECGASGWYMVKREQDDKFLNGEAETLLAIAKNDKCIYMVSLADESRLAADYNNNAGFNEIWINPESLETASEETPGYMKCYAARQIAVENDSDRRVNTCPVCNDPNEPINMIGTQTATLASLSVGQLLSSNLEDAQHRKILAFSNGVQDASHDASFFEARNFRFMFRTAVQKAVGATEGPITLEHLWKRFTEYWKHEEPGFDEEKYVYILYPYDLEGRDPLKSQKIDDRFLDEFDLRMTWQITQEYGYGAFIGRTLEKTGSSATYFKEEELREAYRLMQPWLENNGRRDITESSFIRFLNIVLHRMRLRGGIDHPYLQAYRHDLSSYCLNNPTGHWLNRKFGKKQRWPLMVTTSGRKDKLRNALDSTYRRNNKTAVNWFHSFYERNFCRDMAIQEEYYDLINNFYVELFNALRHVGIVNAVESGTITNYAIDPGHIYISHNVKHIRCGECRNIIRIAGEDTLCQDAVCMGHLCSGRYTEPEEIRLNYYHNVYHRNHIPRVYSHEHNGMLDRKKREEIEESFIKQDKPDSINTLVATSTLEMGIDIGDLNCGINISVPPTTANFAQRIGRAGRKSGASLIVNYAKRDKPHDLFYYAEPTEMMNGDVATPGCYLKAKEILFRHFYAFCIDSWSAASAGHKIPKNAGDLPLGSNFMADPNFFIHQLRSWILANFVSLTDRFKSQYEGDVRYIVLPGLFNLFKAGRYFDSVEKAFRHLDNDYRRIVADYTRVRQMIKSGTIPESDPEYQDLVNQARMLSHRREGMETMSVLEFMTDSGLLPNYAFPETGVKLSAVVKDDSKSKTPQDDEFELVRPASQGIKELAPGNDFFARHFKLKIDGLDTTDWNDKGTVAEKRFCSECDYLEDESTEHPAMCPKCGSPSFGAASNVHKFVKLEWVKSWMKRSEAMADDRKDERESKYYRISRHFKFKEDGAVSYAMKEIPFGIQYVKNAEITDVNLGDGDILTAQNLDINGLENVQRHGFVVCRHCGRAVNTPAEVNRIQDANKRLAKWHYPYCKHKDKEYEGLPNDIFEETYLFRHLPTEAIKVLLPVGEIDTKAQVDMFKAGLMLGMRDIFGGEPSHIQIRDYREMNRTTGKWDNYLVIFDTIPGGSGYLDKLKGTKDFTQLLKSAYYHIRDCKCQHSGKDGCYHCILSYGNQFDQKNLSREKAEDLFRRIVEKSDKWETVNGTLGGINTSGGIEESELEERFIRTLKRYAEKHGGQFEINSEFGSKIYLMTIDDRHFVITPQYALDRSKNVKYYTIADFLITEVNSSNKSIAVYLDGYRFHGASVEGQTPRFFHDLEQRESIIKSRQYIPWTLTWDDLDLADDTSGKKQNLADSLYMTGNDQTKLRVKRSYGRNSKLASCLNSFERLLFALLNPGNVAQEAAIMLIEHNSDLKAAMHSDKELNPYLNSGTPSYNFTLKPTNEGYIFTTTAPRNSSWLRTMIGINGKKPSEAKYKIETEVSDKDLEKDIWNHFWRLHNVLGMLGPDSIFSEDSIPQKPADVTSEEISLEGLLDAYDNDDLNDMITLLHDAGVKINKKGFFCLEEDGEIIADALLGNENLKFAVTEDPTARKALEKKGYQVIVPSDIETLKKIINP